MPFGKNLTGRHAEFGSCLKIEQKKNRSFARSSGRLWWRRREIFGRGKPLLH
jgi:hypothetical protein